MYKLNDKEFLSASDALDYYIKTFQMSNIKHMETRAAKSTTKEFRLDKLENLMSTKLNKPIFNNLIVPTENSSCNQIVTANSLALIDSIDRGSETGMNAINQIEKLISNLSHKIEDYKAQGDNVGKQSVNFSYKEDSKHNTSNESNDPILKSLKTFEDLNKQFSSQNLFTRIESSLAIDEYENLNKLKLNKDQSRVGNEKNK